MEDVSEKPGIADLPRRLLGLPDVRHDLLRLAEPDGE